MDDDNCLLVYFLFKLYSSLCQGDFACGDHPAESGPVYAVTDYLNRYTEAWAQKTSSDKQLQSLRRIPALESNFFICVIVMQICALRKKCLWTCLSLQIFNNFSFLYDEIKMNLQKIHIFLSSVFVEKFFDLKFFTLMV
jgi:hypothetical protein